MITEEKIVAPVENTAKETVNATADTNVDTSRYEALFTKSAFEVEESPVVEEKPGVVIESIDIGKNDPSVMLFTTKTCPNCAIAKEYLGDLPYKLIDALEQPELSRKYGVQMAPTLVVDNGDTVVKYVRASEIKKYVEEQKSVFA